MLLEAKSWEGKMACCYQLWLGGGERRRCGTYWTCCCCYWSICSITMIKECVSISTTAATSLSHSPPSFFFFLLYFFSFSYFNYYFFPKWVRKSIRSLSRFTLWAHKVGAGLVGKDPSAKAHQLSPQVCNKLTSHLKIKSWPPANKASCSKY